MHYNKSWLLIIKNILNINRIIIIIYMLYNIYLTKNKQMNNLIHIDLPTNEMEEDLIEINIDQEDIQEKKFWELQISTIYWILNKSQERIDHNLLIDFIIESSETRFIFFKLNLNEDKISRMIEFIEEQEEETKNKSFSSTVIRSKIHQKEESNLFIFQMVKKHRVSPAALI